MVEIRYGENYESVDLVGHSVAEARTMFRDEFDIPDRARARLNGKKVQGKLEAGTRLCHDDRLTFAEERSRGAFLIASMLLALVITGSVFAYGYVTNSTELNVTAAGGDFASVTGATDNVPSWTPFGLFKGATGSGDLFEIDTASVNYTGDLVATVYIANGDDLVKAYRVLAMFLEVRDSGSNLVDVNGDNTANATNDYALLTLSNGAVDLFIHQTQADTYTVKLTSGFYVSHIWGLGWGAYANPTLYCEVAQRG